MKPSGRSGKGGEQAEQPAAAAEDVSAELKLRTDSDYRRLALQILNSQAWKTMLTGSGRKKSRVIARLMNHALSGG
ncbi:hypothetical protein CCGE525_38060 (plasmid) [Rhizobium jaguaris]|uniref:Uncharacterized protein n=2 Tax=Rhizobium jaguaris TaxID=1312183 RepID=A0A387FZQ6_9HYPH|nr:hypothetical protein CCGE525_38060 [Rhizobium jaguaris]